MSPAIGTFFAASLNSHTPCLPYVSEECHRGAAARGTAMNDIINTGQEWIHEAVAEQEEYIKRIRSCQDVVGRGHVFRTFGRPTADGTIPGAKMWSGCIVCGVTETAADFAIKRSQP